MPRTVTIEEIRAKLPHIDADQLKGRYLPAHCLHTESGEWYLWMPDNDGCLHRLAATPAEACYYSTKPVGSSDIYLSAVDFLDRQANFEGLHSLYKSLLEDIYNLSASLAKIDLVFAAKDTNKGAGRMAATELEYLFLSCRSVYDVLQEIVSRLWNHVDLRDKSLRKRNLPKSYRPMVIRSNERMSVEDIVSKHHIPVALAAAYHRSGKFFEWLRQYRDYIAHSGQDFELVFVAENGFAIYTNVMPFSDMDIWCTGNTLPNNLGSLKSAACHVVHVTLNSCDAIIGSLKDTICFPPPIAPNHKVYICGHNTDQLRNVAARIKDEPWQVKTANKPEKNPSGQQ